MNKTYKCQGCGGPLTFDQDTQKLKCPYCGLDQDVNEFESVDEVLIETQNDTEEVSNDNPIYVCSSCGGEVVMDTKTTAAACPFCDNPIVLSNKFSRNFKVDYIVPFKNKKTDMETAFLAHMENKKFLPQIFKNQNILKEIKGLYVPYWVFDLQLASAMEFKGEIINEKVIGDKKQITTTYYDVTRKGKAHFKDLPISASKQLDEKMLDSLEPFDLALKQNFTPDYLAGFYAENYDTTIDEKITHVLKRTQRTLEDEIIKSISEYDDLDTVDNNNELINQSVKYALLPIWLLTTRFNNEEYVFAMNGISGKLIGDLPFDKNAYLKFLVIRFVIVSGIIYGILTLLS